MVQVPTTVSQLAACADVCRNQAYGKIIKTIDDETD